jgi:hypothetical protein
MNVRIMNWKGYRRKRCSLLCVSWNRSDEYTNWQDFYVVTLPISVVVALFGSSAYWYDPKATRAFRTLLFTASNTDLISVRVHVAFWILPGWAQKYHQHPQSECEIPGSRFDGRTSRIRRTISHKTWILGTAERIFTVCVIRDNGSWNLLYARP